MQRRGQQNNTAELPRGKKAGPHSFCKDQASAVSLVGGLALGVTGFFLDGEEAFGVISTRSLAKKAEGALSNKKKHHQNPRNDHGEGGRLVEGKTPLLEELDATFYEE